MIKMMMIFGLLSTKIGSWTPSLVYIYEEYMCIYICVCMCMCALYNCV